MKTLIVHTDHEYNDVFVLFVLADNKFDCSCLVVKRVVFIGHFDNLHLVMFLDTKSFRQVNILIWQLPLL